MKLWAFLFLSISVSAAYCATSLPALKNGQCYADPDSKNYLSGLKASTSSAFDRIKSDIGQEKLMSLKDTADVHYYFCQLTCRDANGSLAHLWITQSDNPSQFANMNGFLCAGVSIENVQIVGSIFGPQPVVSAFNAFETDFPEVHTWLKNSEFQLSEQEYEARYVVLKKSLEQVAIAYVQSSSPMLRDAGVQLWEIAARSEAGEKILASKLDKLIKNKWKIVQDYSNSDYYVENVLKQMGRFLEYKKPPEEPMEIYTIEGIRLFP